MKKLLFVTILFVGVMCCACSRAGEDVSGWVDLLEQEGKISVDLDGYLGEETIVLTNEEFEGEQRIKELYVLLNDEKVVIPGVITDSSLESIMKFDFDMDEHPEYVFLMDTHGSGGQGTHEAWILWTKKSTFERLECLDEFQEGEQEGGVDSLYHIEYVDGDFSKMQTYQYTYRDGHSDYQGDLVSVVAYDTDLGVFQVEDSWVEK